MFGATRHQIQASWIKTRAGSVQFGVLGHGAIKATVDEAAELLCYSPMSLSDKVSQEGWRIWKCALNLFIVFAISHIIGNNVEFNYSNSWKDL